jgi:ADP-heptose:LPS heptosyltransferase
MPRRILVLRGGALGDFIVTLPALAALRRAWPDARLALAGNATAAALGVEAGLIDQVHSQHEARWSALYLPSPLEPAFSGWLRDFDLVVNFWPDPAGDLARRFPLRAGQRYLSASAAPALSPAAAHFCSALLPLGISTAEFLFPLGRPRAAPARAGAPVALHPGSGSPRKNWPLDRWRSLALWLQRDLGVAVTVISGEAEPDDVLAGIGTRVRGRPLAELAGHLAGCRLFIGHDSGISHLAAAAGAPGVLLFGPTDPRRWAPPAPTMRVLQRGADPASISLAEVQGAVLSALRDQS